MIFKFTFKFLELTNSEVMVESKQENALIFTDLKYLILNGGPNLHEIDGDLNASIRLTDFTLLTTLALMKNILCICIGSNTHQVRTVLQSYLYHFN